MASSRRAAGSSSVVSSTAEIFQKKWTRYFFFTIALQALICIVFEAYTFGKFEGGLKSGEPTQDNAADGSTVNSQLKTIPTFLSLIIFGFIYQLILVWDALRMKNTIQIIGICLANLILMIYTALQIDQINSAVYDLTNDFALSDTQLWSEVKGLLIAIPVVLAVVTVIISFMAWKLYQEFAWDILKQIGADYRMKKRFLHYQIYIALLKFDFFFFVGFTLQFLVVVTGKTDTELGLTIAAIPFTIIILILAVIFTRREFRWGMGFIILIYLGGLAYFIFKLFRIYDPHHYRDYLAVRRSLTAFAVMTIILIILTIINCMVCMFNFGHGLKDQLMAPRQQIDKDQGSYSMSDTKQPVPSRMTIE